MAPRYLDMFTWDFRASCPQHISGVQDGCGAAALRVKSCQLGGGKKERKLIQLEETNRLLDKLNI